MPAWTRFLCWRLRYLEFVALGLLAGCVSVPLDLPKGSSLAIPDSQNTDYGQLAAGWTELHQGKSGFFPFVYGLDALGARLEMIGRAQSSIDLQYFLMKGDAAGVMVSQALRRAADRGVRIRFLLDDVFTTAPDQGLLTLNAHSNIEVRLFNPISRRGLHSLNFIGHFRRANRRMHNKSFTVDNAISIVGGRNIADEYFQLKTDAVFSDLDVLAFGPVVNQVSESFDSFWNHQLAIPVEQLLGKLHNQSVPVEGAPAGVLYNKARSTDLIQRLTTGEQPLFVADAMVIADSPDKLQQAVGLQNQALGTELGELLSQAEHEVIFISPYYVPGNDGIEFVKKLTQKGVRITVVTNSLASTNHIPVHSAYSGFRKKALRAGVDLYEVRANAGQEAQGRGGPDRLTLHTKLIVVDRRYLFIGSLNLDPRSIEINAEMGLWIDSPELAEQVAVGLTADLPQVAYRVVNNSRNMLEWHLSKEGQQVVLHSEPLSTRWRRFKAWFLRIVPQGQL